MNEKKKRNLKKLWITLGIVFGLIIVLFGSFLIYAEDYYHADDYATACLNQENENVQVKKEKNGNIAFIPESINAGFIFYPGGKVEHTAYTPLMRSLSEQGILCVLVKMPFRLAFFDMDAAKDIVNKYKQTDKWYIGGHSLGGAIAASYVAKHTKEYEGLALLAAYSTSDMSKSSLKTFSIYGSNDKVLSMDKYKKNLSNLPSSLQEEVIEGGCHAYFGSYGKQKGDGKPTITNQEQIAITSNSLVNWINEN